MLKACWDCLVGNGTRAEEPYGSQTIQLNGNINRAPPWPSPQLKNEKMFILPKILGSRDKIVIQGETSYQRQQFSIGLVTGYSSPDYSNIACQLEIYFNDPDKIAIQIIENGNTDTIYQEDGASDYFADPQSFEVQFRMQSENTLDVLVGESYLQSIPLRHDVSIIRYLTVNGDVDKVSRLDFNFG